MVLYAVLLLSLLSAADSPLSLSLPLFLCALSLSLFFRYFTLFYSSPGPCLQI